MPIHAYVTVKRYQNIQTRKASTNHTILWPTAVTTIANKNSTTGRKTTSLKILPRHYTAIRTDHY